MVASGLILKGLNALEDWAVNRAEQRKVISVADMSPTALVQHQVNAIWDGEKFAGGFDTAKIFQIDYWSLRLKSKQLFHENIYARGIIRRLVTNEINTGLVLESTPIFNLLPINEDEASVLSDIIETRFEIWSNNPNLCDLAGMHTFGQLQKINRMNALISGDVLNVLRMDRVTGLPSIQLIAGDSVQTPIDFTPKPGNKIVHGVEINERTNRHVAFHVIQEDYSSRRIPAMGRKSGRRIAWLSYGTEMLLDGVRGIPFLGISLQALKEVDRIKDAAQRTAVIQATVAMIIKKTEARPGTRPLTGAAAKRENVTVTDADGTARNMNFSKYMPGLIMDELSQGEEPVPFDTSRMGVDFEKMEQAIIRTLAWGNEIPPGILMMLFNKSHSASVAESNEFETFLKASRANRVADFCQPIQTEWLISEILQGRVPAPGFIEAWRDPLQFDVFGAWTSSQWMGSSKPRIDPLKEAKAYELMVRNGWMTNSLAARRLTNTSFDKNTRRAKKENELLIESFEAILKLKARLGGNPDKGIKETIESAETAFSELLDKMTDEVVEI